MSSTITAYAIRLEKLNRAIGSHDSQLISAIANRQANFLAGIDEINDEAEITCLEAVKHLVQGEDLNQDYGYLYGYALEALCRQLGTELPNVSGITGANEWMEEIDAALGTHNVPLSMSDLVYCGSPILIPEPDDYPSIGCWPVPRIAAALHLLERIDKKTLDPQVAETFAQLEEWMTTALQLGSEIIGFLS